MGPQAELALILVISAAFLHAFWNALLKGSQDRVLGMAMMTSGPGIVGLVMVWLFLPPARESWPFIIASTIIHYFYYGFLLLSYRLGDLSHVYPIARGIAPVLVAVGAFVFAGEILPPIAWLAIGMVSCGIGVLFLFNHKGVSDKRAIATALITGLTIATYSVVDGLGVRHSQNPLGYIGWLFVLKWFAVPVFFYLRRSVVFTTPAKVYLLGLAGGVISCLAYGLVIYAKGIAPLGAVSAVRESSVIIAALIGVIWFKERPWKPRILAALIVATGVILLATS